MAASTSGPISVFISYSRTDSAAIDRLETGLVSYGVRTWVDRQHLEGGAKWAAQIEHAIQASDVVVVGLSPDSVKSPWVTNELFYAYRLNKPIIPVLMGYVDVVPLLLSALQHVDMVADELQGLRQLYQSVRNLAGRAALEEEISPIVPHVSPIGERADNPQTKLVALPPQVPVKVRALSWLHEQAEHVTRTVAASFGRDAANEQGLFLGPGRIAVFFRTGVSVGQAQRLLSSNDARPLRIIPRKHCFLAYVLPGTEKQVINRLRVHPYVRDVTYVDTNVNDNYDANDSFDGFVNEDKL